MRFGDDPSFELSLALEDESVASLQLPTFLDGPQRDVERACRGVAARVAKGASLAELPEDWIDVADMAGYILINEPYRSPEQEPSYHGYLLAKALLDAFDNIADPRWDRVFDELLTQPWLIYCFLGQDSYFLFQTPERARRFVVAVRDQWETLNLPGRKFLTDRPEWFLRAQRTLGTSLGTLGATNEELVREFQDPAYADGARPPVVDRYAK